MAPILARRGQPECRTALVPAARAVVRAVIVAEEVFIVLQ
jgi:hypothetical protein